MFLAIGDNRTTPSIPVIEGKLPKDIEDMLDNFGQIDAVFGIVIKYCMKTTEDVVVG